jgi:hypothetical protein
MANIPEQEYVKRGRGRPKKNQMVNNYEKKKKPVENDMLGNVRVKEASLTQVKDEIILHFPLITMSDIMHKNSEQENEIKNDPHDIFTINDGNLSNTKSDSDYNMSEGLNNIAVIELKQQIDEQKYIISSLQNEIENYKSLMEKYDLSNRNVSKINVLLIDTNTDNIIIPESTEIACWWCSHNFTEVQCVLPENIYNDNWYVGGCYCCIECAAADNFSRNDSNVWNRYSLLKQLYKVDNIVPTPDKRIFTKFGGEIIHENFKKNAHKCDKIYRMIMPPMASIIPLVEETTNDSTRVSVTMNDLKRNVKLKRSKPLPNVKDNLFK